MSQEMNRVLVGTPPPPPTPVASAIVEVAKAHGISPIKQFSEIASLFFGAPKLGSNEYYAAGLFRTDLTKAQKKQFVGVKSNLMLNQQLSPSNIASISDFLDNKVLYTSLLEHLGLSTTTLQAVVSNSHGFGELTTLRSTEAIEAFLLNEAKFPVFGKPIEGTKSIGTALFASLDRKTQIITLGNGDTTTVSELAREIFEDFADGFVFQNAVTQHKDVNAVIGSAIGTVRFVTLMQDGAPQVLYAVWKIPAPDAMSDNFWQKGSLIAEVEVSTGQIKQARRGTGMEAEQIETHPVSDVKLAEFTLPHWDSALTLVQKCHGLTPENGILGWDIAIAPDGPLVIECNTSPFHTLYQVATGRGILNDDFSPKFAKVFARNEAITNQQKAAAKSQKR